MMKLSGMSTLENRRENLKLNAFLVVVLVFESKALLFRFLGKRFLRMSHHVIFMDCTIIEHGSRQINAREIAQLLKYFLT